MVAVQAEGCAPIYKAWSEGKEFAPLWTNDKNVAAGIRVQIANSDFLIIRIVIESNGFSVSVTEDEIPSANDEVSTQAGTHLCPEVAATFSAFKTSLNS